MEKQLYSCRNEAFQERPVEPHLYLKDVSCFAFFLASQQISHLYAAKHTFQLWEEKHCFSILWGEKIRRGRRGGGKEGLFPQLPGRLEALF